MQAGAVEVNDLHHDISEHFSAANVDNAAGDYLNFNFPRKAAGWPLACSLAGQSGVERRH